MEEHVSLRVSRSSGARWKHWTEKQTKNKTLIIFLQLKLYVLSSQTTTFTTIYIDTAHYAHVTCIYTVIRPSTGDIFSFFSRNFVYQIILSIHTILYV